MKVDPYPHLRAQIEQFAHAAYRADKLIHWRCSEIAE
jgi:hypothetical protein